MKSLAILGLGGFALMLAGTPAMSTAPVATTYSLAMQIHDGDRLVGSPKLTMAEGEPATIEIGDTPGDHYHVTMTATAQPGGTVFVKSKIDVVAGGVHQALSPELEIALNRPSAIAFGVESPISKPIRIDFTLDKVG